MKERDRVAKEAMKEVAIMADLPNHKRVIQVYGWAWYHALYGYCLVGKELLSHHHGLVRGGTLFKRLEDELSPDFQMNIAQIMAHLHRQGTAHRDLKAMHVVLDANNRCKVISD